MPRRLNGWVLAQAFDPPFEEGDCSYHSLLVASDGNVYFTISTHRIDWHARFCCFDPSRDRIVFAKDIGEALKEAGWVLPQGKVHVPLIEEEGKIYFATHVGYYGRRTHERTRYPGFHVLCYDLKSGQLEDLVHGPSEEGMIASILDRRPLTYYGLSWPSGLLCRCGVYDGTLEVLPPPCRRIQPSHRGRWVSRDSICRALGLDREGRLYGACISGAVWRYEEGGVPELLPDVNVLDGAVGPTDRSGKANNLWREIVWDDVEGCFFAIHAGTQSLLRFDPQAMVIEPMARLSPAAFQGLGHAPLGSQLGMVVGRNRVIYHIAHGPPTRIAGRRRVRRSAHLVSYHLETREVLDHGPLRLFGGERVTFAESIAMDLDGNLYSVAWVEVADSSDYARFKRLRAVASNGECRGEVYRMMLLRIPAREFEPVCQK